MSADTVAFLPNGNADHQHPGADWWKDNDARKAHAERENQRMMKFYKQTQEEREKREAAEARAEREQRRKREAS